MLRIAPASLLAAALAWSCDAPAERAAEPAAADPTPAVRIDLERSIHPDLPSLTFTLLGSAEPGGEAVRVESIEVRRRGEAEPFQVLPAGADLDLASLPDRVDFLDVDFDGYDDLRLVESLPAGPNVPWIHWLWRPEAGRFERAPELDALSGLELDPAAGTLLARWRDGATRYGTELYRWQDGDLVLERREIREYSEPGTYHLTVAERRRGEMVETESRTVRE